MRTRFILAFATSVQMWAALESVAQVTSPLSSSAGPRDTFTNPLLETRPDLDLAAYAEELVETFDIATRADGVRPPAR